MAKRRGGEIDSILERGARGAAGCDPAMCAIAVTFQPEQPDGVPALLLVTHTILARDGRPDHTWQWPVMGDPLAPYRGVSMEERADAVAAAIRSGVHRHHTEAGVDG